MPTRTTVARIAPLVGALLVPGVSAAFGQARGFDASYGLWWFGDAPATAFSASVHQPLLGPFGYSLGFTHLDDRGSAADRTASGAELSLTVGRDGAGLYVVGAVGMGFLHEDGELDGSWSAGAGYLLRPLSVISLGVEARYRVEDTGLAGFWRLAPDDRRGILVQGRVAIALGGASRPPAASDRGPSGSPPRAPSTDDIVSNARRHGAPEEAVRLTTTVVETALSAMGAPYEWGGSDENGFDCSGLIQYAYGQHGIILPRTSRDQMRMGTRVDPRLDALWPGDLLGFSVEGTSQITHVGLYVGDGQFIHSASDGVKLSSLTAIDPDSRWWQHRWVAARRIVE